MHLKLILCISAIFLFMSCHSIPATENNLHGRAIESLEDFEEDFHWFPQSCADSTDYSISCEATEEWCSSGAYSCSLVTMPCYSEHISSFSTEYIQSVDLQRTKTIIADFFNTTWESVIIWFVIETADCQYTLTTKKEIINPGENIDIAFNLILPDKNDTNIFETGKFTIFIKANSYISTVFIDNIRVAE